MDLDKVRLAGGVETPRATKIRKRDTRKGLLTRHDPAVHKQLKQLALDNDTDVQGLVEEALNMLFLKYQRQAIA